MTTGNKVRTSDSCHLTMAVPGRLLSKQDRISAQINLIIIIHCTMSISSLSLSSPRHRRRDYIQYFCVVDFEATCWDEQQYRRSELNELRNKQEIIEFPLVVVNRDGEIVPNLEFHHYIRPQIIPQLSHFCTQLTGITQVCEMCPFISLSPSPSPMRFPLCRRHHCH